MYDKFSLFIVAVVAVVVVGSDLKLSQASRIQFNSSFVQWAPFYCPSPSPSETEIMHNSPTVMNEPTMNVKHEH